MNLISLWDAIFDETMRFSGKRVHVVTRIHATKKGPARSKGMKFKQNDSGTKIARKAFEGLCTIRSGKIGAAGRLALEGKLNAH